MIKQSAPVLLIFILFFALIGLVSSVRAQDYPDLSNQVMPSQTPTPNSEPEDQGEATQQQEVEVQIQSISQPLDPNAVLLKERLSEDILRTKKRLLTEIETYFQQEKNYRIAKDQYLRHQTLSSIEEAVRATKGAMEARNRVLLTHLYLIKLNLIEAEGIEVTQKTQALDYLDRSLESLNQHQELILKIASRDDVAAAAVEFELLVPDAENASYYALSLVSIGRLQTVFDDARLLEQKIREADLEPDSSLEDSKQDRAFEETSKLMVQIRDLLGERWTELAQMKIEDYEYKRYYRSVFRDLNLVYSRLSQLLSYLQELLTYGKK